MRLSLLLALGVLSAATPALADLQLSHQGRLIGPSDAPCEGAKSLTFRLYSKSDGSTNDIVWTETYDVQCLGGYYAQVLGDPRNGKKPIKGSDVAGERWLAVVVDQVELLPRLTVGAVASAINADNLGGKPASEYALKTDVSSDAETLDGHPASDFALKTDVAPNALKLGGVAADEYALKSDLSADASALTSGTLPDARLSAAIPRLAAANAFTGSNAFAAATSFTGATFNGVEGVPFTVPSNASGLVANLNAELLGGKRATDFLLAATYKPPQAGAERLVLNFDEGAAGGTTVRDSSGAGNDGSFTASTLTRTTAGHNNTGALTFAAGGGLVTIPDTGALGITNNVTMEAWVFPTAYPAGGSEGIILMKENSYGLKIDTAGRLNVAVQTAVGGTWVWNGSSLPLPLSAWSYVAATYNGVDLQIFLNGINVSTTAFPYGPISVNTNPLTIGGRTATNVGSFVGSIDEVRVSAIAKAFRPASGFIKLGMGDTQGSLSNGTVVRFDTVRYARGLTSSSNGVNLKAGRTYRLESTVNLYSQGSNNYVGFRFHNGTALFGDECYSGMPAGSSASYAFHASCLEYYTPTSDQTVTVRVIDPGAPLLHGAWGTNFTVSEVP